MDPAYRTSTCDLCATDLNENIGAPLYVATKDAGVEVPGFCFAVDSNLVRKRMAEGGSVGNAEGEVYPRTAVVEVRLPRPNIMVREPEQAS